MRGHPRRCRYAGNAQERHVQLPGGLSEQAYLTDQAKDAALRGWQLPRDEVVLTLDEGILLLFFSLFSLPYQSIRFLRFLCIVVHFFCSFYG